jgi:hypothetical protein
LDVNHRVNPWFFCESVFFESVLKIHQPVWAPFADETLNTPLDVGQTPMEWGGPLA